MTPLNKVKEFLVNDSQRKKWHEAWMKARKEVTIAVIAGMAVVSLIKVLPTQTYAYEGPRDDQKEKTETEAEEEKEESKKEVESTKKAEYEQDDYADPEAAAAEISTQISVHTLGAAKEDKSNKGVYTVEVADKSGTSTELVGGKELNVAPGSEIILEVDSESETFKNNHKILVTGGDGVLKTYLDNQNQGKKIDNYEVKKNELKIGNEAAIVYIPGVKDFTVTLEDIMEYEKTGRGIAESLYKQIEEREYENQRTATEEEKKEGIEEQKEQIDEKKDKSSEEQKEVDAKGTEQIEDKGSGVYDGNGMGEDKTKQGDVEKEDEEPSWGLTEEEPSQGTKKTMDEQDQTIEDLEAEMDDLRG